MQAAMERPQFGGVMFRMVAFSRRFAFPEGNTATVSPWSSLGLGIPGPAIPQLATLVSPAPS